MALVLPPPGQMCITQALPKAPAGLEGTLSLPWEWSSRTGSHRGAAEPWGMHWPRTSHLLWWVPKQPRLVVQGRVSARPGGRRICPLSQAGGSDTAVPASPVPACSGNVPLMPGLGRCFLGALAALGACPPSSGSPDLEGAQLFPRLVLARGTTETAGEGGSVTRELSPHLLSPSCPGRSTAWSGWGESHPSFPVSLPGSIPEHAPSKRGPPWR